MPLLLKSRIRYHVWRRHSKSGEIVDLGVELEVIKKSGSWFSYGDTKLGQGRDAVKNLLRDNPELTLELEQKIAKLLQTTGKQVLADK